MPDLTREDVKETIEKALSDFARSAILAEAMKDAVAYKLEYSFGFDCRNPEKRDEMRETMGFINDLRKRHGDEVDDSLDFIAGIRNQTRKGGEKLFLVAIGIFGGGFILWFVSKVWPDGMKYFSHP